MRVADYVASFLVENDMKDVFMVSGGGLMFLTDGLACNDKIHTICCHHEQAVAMAAVAYAKYKEGIGCGYFTTGCGGTNAITGVLHAWQDNTACLFISGQIKRKETTRNHPLPLRQLGVQEADIVKLVEPITKYSVMINEADEIAYHLEKAVYLAKSGRRGPVWLDIPMDVQSALIDPLKLKHFNESEIEERIKLFPTEAELQYVIEKIKSSKRPVLVAGQGVRLSGAIGLFSKFIHEHKIPFVSTRLGLDVMPTTDDFYIGRIGNKGTRAANFTVQNADLLLVLGSRLSVSSTGHEYGLFAREADVIVVDIDTIEHKKNTVKITKEINADIKTFLSSLILPNDLEFVQWASHCNQWKSKYPVCLDEYYSDDSNGINLYAFTQSLSKQLKEDSVIITDAGSAVYVPAQTNITNSSNQRYITSGAQAEMGFTLPGCIGVSVARDKKETIGISGDGSFQMNIQELQTVVHNNLPIKLFVWNNNGYLSIRASQNKFFNARHIGTDSLSGVSFPELKKIADAYGIKYFKMDKLSSMDDIFKNVLSANEPVICEVMCISDQAIQPNVSARTLEDGRLVSSPLEDMFPFLDRDEFLKNMIGKPVDVETKNNTKK